ncbi:hypothetical protein M3172_03670 [Mesobacillus subterraneus]|uniref:hypothetical protein n=1 Tax=Mesobacillus subterraneus TaxID=285983 RepID=UPI00204105CD|nr:hypothetical protein [Mesobacillus subterraneus]MCM3572275.1 hypothetical protein [Mesobacillus subterraneus]
MALIKKMVKVERNASVHKEVQADYQVFEIKGKKYLQINSYGSATRKDVGKLSQSMQFNEDSIRQLINLLKETIDEN